MRTAFIVACCVLVANAAIAQEDPATETTEQIRITPPDGQQPTPDILSTKPAAAPQPAKAATPSPFGKAAGPMNSMPDKPAAPNATAPQANKYQPDYVPFGRATPSGPTIPSGPHTAVAIPVEEVQAIDSSDKPAVPNSIAPEEDPATEDPEKPTEFSSPMFNETDNPKGGRKISFRALNKVTAQSTLYAAAPGAVVNFGQMEITAVSCRVSSPNSLSDSAGLFDIYEKLSGKEEGKKRLLFRGWMYASSPSIAAIENPVYDVTMVSCDFNIPAASADDKSTKKPEKKAKK